MIKNTWISRRNRFSWLYLLPGMLLMMAAGEGRAAGQTAFDPAAIDQFIAGQMRAERVPGLALAITRGDQLLYLQGYGSAGNGQPVTPQTRFFIGSVSKSFTAMAVMQLVEAGKIELDAPVQTYLPEFTLAEPAAAAQITIRQLLNHTSGLSEIGFPDMRLPQPKTIADRVISLRSARPVARPGSEYHYFSPNYSFDTIRHIPGSPQFAATAALVAEGAQNACLAAPAGHCLGIRSGARVG